MKMKMKRKLYPRSTDPMVHITGKIQECLFAAMEELATREVKTRSEVHRQLLVEALRARGVVATADEMVAAP